MQAAEPRRSAVASTLHVLISRQGLIPQVKWPKFQHTYSSVGRAPISPALERDHLMHTFCSPTRSHQRNVTRTSSHFQLWHTCEYLSFPFRDPSTLTDGLNRPKSPPTTAVSTVTEMSNSEAQNTPTSFHSAMLNKPANEKIEDILQDRELRSLIPKCGSNRQTSYGMLLQLLNRASLLIHGTHALSFDARDDSKN